MIRVVKHSIAETTAEHDARIERIKAAIRAEFPDVTTEIVQGLLDGDRVVEAGLPLRQLREWRDSRAKRVQPGDPSSEPG